MSPDDWNARWKELDAQVAEARAKGTLVGRIIRHPFADGYAVYEITKVTSRTARLRVVTGLGDDWILPAWGEECSIPLARAKEFLDKADRLAAFFGGKTVVEITPTTLVELRKIL